LKLLWYRKIRKRKVEDSLVGFRLDLNADKSRCGKILVFWRRVTIQDNMSYWKNLKPAVCSLRRAFRRRRDRCNVIGVDEYVTTRCSRCAEPMPPKHTWDKDGRRRHNHRFQYCQKCEIHWNRDINVARNIVLVARGLVDFRKKYNSKTKKKSYNI